MQSTPIFSMISKHEVGASHIPPPDNDFPGSLDLHGVSKIVVTVPPCCSSRAVASLLPKS